MDELHARPSIAPRLAGSTRARPTTVPSPARPTRAPVRAPWIWLTTNFGKSWVDLNLPASSNLLEVSGHTTVDTFGSGAAIFVQHWVNGCLPLVVATSYGVFVSFTPILSDAVAPKLEFKRLGAGMPNVIVNSIVYSYESDLLVLATLGRGIFAMQRVSATLEAAFAGTDTTTATKSCLGGIYPNVNGAFGYSAAGGVSPVLTGSPATRAAFVESAHNTVGTGGEAGPVASTGGTTLPSGTTQPSGTTTQPSGTVPSGTTPSGTTTGGTGTTPAYDQTATVGVEFKLTVPNAALTTPKGTIEADIYHALKGVRPEQILFISSAPDSTSNSGTVVKVEFSYKSSYTIPGKMFADFRAQSKSSTSPLLQGTYTKYIKSGSVIQTSGPVCTTCAANIIHGSMALVLALAWAVQAMGRW